MRLGRRGRVVARARRDARCVRATGAGIGPARTPDRRSSQVDRLPGRTTVATTDAGTRDRRDRQRRSARVWRWAGADDRHPGARGRPRHGDAALHPDRPGHGSHRGLRQPPVGARAGVVADPAGGRRDACGLVAGAAIHRHRHLRRVGLGDHVERHGDDRPVPDRRRRPPRRGRQSRRYRCRVRPPQLPARAGRAPVRHGASVDNRRGHVSHRRGLAGRQRHRRAADGRCAGDHDHADRVGFAGPRPPQHRRTSPAGGASERALRRPPLGTRPGRLRASRRPVATARRYTDRRCRANQHVGRVQLRRPRRRRPGEHLVRGVAGHVHRAARPAVHQRRRPAPVVSHRLPGLACDARSPSRPADRRRSRGDPQRAAARRDVLRHHLRGPRGVRDRPRIRPDRRVPRPRGKPRVPVGRQLFLARRPRGHQAAQDRSMA